MDRGGSMRKIIIASSIAMAIVAVAGGGCTTTKIAVATPTIQALSAAQLAYIQSAATQMARPTDTPIPTSMPFPPTPTPTPIADIDDTYFFPVRIVVVEAVGSLDHLGSLLISPRLGDSQWQAQDAAATGTGCSTRGSTSSIRPYQDRGWLRSERIGNS